MMALVWLIDAVVIIVKVLGGQTNANPVLRYGMWLALLCILAAGFGALGYLLLLLQHHLGSNP
ncbi:MAG: hypothetical protein HOQ24_11355 [Mycobacteriaceae bacterium]|nr:hypothetical protein [Mycobacteriaceae bacterium]